MTIALSDDLEHVLTVSNKPFRETASLFYKLLPEPAEYFTYACQLLERLEDVNASHIQVLNAEFILYWLYKDFDIKLNPFISHWIEFLQDKDREMDLAEAERTGFENTRIHFIKNMLAGEGSKLAYLTPAEYTESFYLLELSTNYDVPLVEAVSQQTQHDTAGNEQDNTPSLYLDASSKLLSENERNQLLARIPEAITSIMITSDILSELLAKNPSVGHAIVVELLKHDNNARMDLLTNVLPHLPAELSCLECIKEVLMNTNEKQIKKDEQVHLLHLFLANAFRDADRQERKIQLLCLFLRNLWVQGCLDVVEFDLELQEVRYRFIWVREARELCFEMAEARSKDGSGTSSYIQTPRDV